MKNMTTTALAQLLLATSCWCAGAAVAAPVQLDPSVRAMVDARIRNGEFRSVVIGLTDGEHSTIAGFGTVGTAAPDGRTVYEIGSVTKTFTALLLAQLVADHKVRLEDAVAQVVPAFRLPHYQGKPITFADVATHSSGLPRLPANLAPKDMANPYVDYGRQQLLDGLAASELTRSPGALYAYSNLGFGMLGEALADHAKLPYGALVAQRITQPLGMQSTSTDISKDMAARLAPGHDASGKPAPNWDMGAMAGAGALKSTAADMLLYVQAMMRARGQPDSPFGLAQAPTALPDTRIGLAWHVSAMRGKQLVWHNGMTGGYASFVGYTDDGRLGVVVLADSARPVDPIGIGSLFPDGANAAPPVTLTASQLARYAGRYELAPGFVLTVTAVADGLTVQATGQPPFAANATGDGEFQIVEVGARLSFKQDAAGVVDSVILRQHGRDLPGKKR